jgi:hypothetical protein
VFDDDNQGDKDDYIGYGESTIGALMGAKNQTSIIDLKNPQNGNISQGKLVVRCEKIEDSNRNILIR